jgi:hypothetical protein
VLDALPLILAVLAGAYLVTGLFMAALLWTNDTFMSWSVRDWLAAIVASPVVYVELWLEDVRKPKARG